jgi:hypothetical protein
VATVYSTRFIAVQGLVGNSDYTVPDGMLAVIRSIDMWQAGGVAAPRSYVGIYDGVAYVTIQALWGDPLDTVEEHWSGRQVAYPGEIIRAQATSESPDIMVSGYLLTLP